MTPLRQRMLQDMGIRNLALNTQLVYVQQISAFARHFGTSTARPKCSAPSRSAPTRSIYSKNVSSPPAA